MNNAVKRSSWHYRLLAFVWGETDVLYMEIIKRNVLVYWLLVAATVALTGIGVGIAAYVGLLFAKLLWAMPILTLLASGILAAVALVRFQPDSWLSAAIETAWTPASLALRATGVSAKLEGIPTAAKNVVVNNWNALFPPVTFVE